MKSSSKDDSKSSEKKSTVIGNSFIPQSLTQTHASQRLGLISKTGSKELFSNQSDPSSSADTLVRSKPTRDFELISVESQEERETELADKEGRGEERGLSVRFLKGLGFKADKPYRTKIGQFAAVTTSASGVLNFSTGCSVIGSAAEWSSLIALFEEVFVHSIKLIYQPLNQTQASHVMAAGGVAGAMLTNTSPIGHAINSGGCYVSLFHGAALYTTCAAMLNNPTMKVVSLAKPHSYSWKNNEKFSQKAVGLDGSTGNQGWVLVGAISSYAGNIQLRTFSDVVLGDGTNAVHLGDVAVIYDLSFRARS